MDQKTIDTLGEPEPVPSLPLQATNGDPEKHQVASKKEKGQDCNTATSQGNAGHELIVYPCGIQLALISLSLCLCVFLVGLVSLF